MQRLAGLLGQGQGLAVLFCSLIAALSQIPGWSDLLFPELAALSSTLLRNPRGTWARSSVQLIALPTLCAGVGMWISSHCSDAGAALLLAVLLLQRLFRLRLAPLLALGLLPQVLPAPELRLVPAVILGAALLALSQALTGSSARMSPARAAAPDRSRGPH